jgi:hypothetical protein
VSRRETACTDAGLGLVLVCSSPAGTSPDPAILIASRIVNQTRRIITTARKSLEEL